MNPVRTSLPSLQQATTTTTTDWHRLACSNRAITRPPPSPGNSGQPPDTCSLLPQKQKKQKRERLPKKPDGQPSAVLPEALGMSEYEQVLLPPRAIVSLPVSRGSGQ